MWLRSSAGSFSSLDCDAEVKVAASPSALWLVYLKDHESPLSTPTCQTLERDCAGHPVLGEVAFATICPPSDIVQESLQDDVVAMVGSALVALAKKPAICGHTKAAIPDSGKS